MCFHLKYILYNIIKIEKLWGFKGLKQTLPKYIMTIYKVIWETQSYLVQEFNMVLEACNKGYKINYLHTQTHLESC
jgi:hypothetical protein